MMVFWPLHVCNFVSITDWDACDEGFMEWFVFKCNWLGEWGACDEGFVFKCNWLGEWGACGEGFVGFVFKCNWVSEVCVVKALWDDLSLSVTGWVRCLCFLNGFVGWYLSDIWYFQLQVLCFCLSVLLLSPKLGVYFVYSLGGFWVCGGIQCTVYHYVDYWCNCKLFCYLWPNWHYLWVILLPISQGIFFVGFCYSSFSSHPLSLMYGLSTFIFSNALLLCCCFHIC